MLNKLLMISVIIVIDFLKRSIDGLAAAIVMKDDENGKWATQRMTQDQYFMCEKPLGKIFF